MKYQYWLILIALLNSFMTTVQANNTDTALGLLAQIPAIPAKATATQCNTGKQIALQAEEISARQLTEQAYSSMTRTAYTGAVTDKQGEALSRMIEEPVTQCIMDVSMAAHDLVHRHLDELKQALNNLQHRKISDDNRCGSGIGMNVTCHNRVIQHYKHNVATQADDFLEKVGTPFDQWRNQVLQCIALRDKASAAVLKTGMSGPFAIQAQTIATQNYSMVRAVADAYFELCDAAVKAVQSLDDQ